MKRTARLNRYFYPRLIVRARLLRLVEAGEIVSHTMVSKDDLGHLTTFITPGQRITIEEPTEFRF